MAERDWLTEQFEANRGHLRAVAYRMLGSRAEAEDAVQEAWLRLNGTDTSEVDNLAGWLTTVVARVSLDMLRSRTSRREEPIEEILPETAERGVAAGDPAYDAEMADAVGPALLVVLDTLPSGERLAFVLHDLFGVPFDEIAVILGRSSDAARQLASRARRRVRGATPPREADLERQREVVNAFLRASRGGDFAALLTVLDPDVVVRADATAVQMGAAPEVRGATAVLNTFLGRAVGAQPAIIDGIAGAAWAPGGRIRAVLGFTVVDGKVAAIDLVADRERLDRLDVELLPREGK
ncbi:MAG TPA: sigma-70 family RNA polymerase sigma factor [Thermomicrobiales bacterium]|jgi:RNA polymerase sigma-70 factor (ECF subfamily)